MVVELNKIYCEDCIDFLNKLDDNSLDCIITSPPYNFGKDYNEYDDKVDFKFENGIYYFDYDLFNFGMNCVLTKKRTE